MSLSVGVMTTGETYFTAVAPSAQSLGFERTPYVDVDVRVWVPPN
jgi:hypothetical protein